MNKNLIRIAAALVALSLIAVPSFAARGTADFTRFYVLGTSLGAGVESSSLNERHQRFSYPAVIARQTGVELCAPTASATEHCFAQPLVTYPGIGPEMVLLTLSPSFGTDGGLGSPVMLSFGRPYNNLSIPGAVAAHALTLTGKEAATGTAQLFAQFILRGLGTAADQALSRQPTFILVEFGANELLGAVLAGTPKALFPLDTFKTSYAALLDKLTAGAATAGMVVSNIPNNPSALPVINTIPPFLIDSTTRKPILGPDKNPIFFIADLGDGKIGQLPPGSKVLLTATTDLVQGYGIPAALKPLLPPLPHIGEPLPDKDVLTPTEISAIVAQADAMNTFIAQTAQAKNIPVADFKGLFDRVSSGKLFVGPFNVTNAYITGGFFSFDGFHFNDIGYTLFANEFIKAINDGYKTEIPLASVADLLVNNGAFFPEARKMDSPENPQFTEEAIAQMLQFAAQPQSRPRLHATNH